MLDSIAQDHTLASPLGACINRLVLPTTVGPLLEGQEQVPALASDLRRFPRFRAQKWLILEYQSTFPTLIRPRESHATVLVDLSRGGLGILHSEQAFPREKLRLKWPNEIARTVEAVRCRWLGPQCYLIGCRFISSPAAGSE